jgi:hypothetical protein
MPQVQEQSFIGTLINPEKEKEKEYTPPPPLKTIEAPRYSPRLVSGVISAAMILILVVGVYYLFVKDIVDDTPVEPGTQSEVMNQSSDSSNESGGELLSIFEDEPSKDSIILEVTARNNTWFTINADGKKSEEVLLASGQSGRWTAVEYFILSISNNGGAIFKRNGQTLDNIGKEGTIIREMKITANEMLTSAMPYSDSDGNADQKKAVERPKTEPAKQATTKPVEKTVKPKPTTTAAVKKTASTTSKPKTKASDIVKPKKKTAETTTPTKKKSETITKKKTETTKKKSTNEKNKAITKKKVSEKSKAADKKKKSTTSKTKETKKATPKKPITEKKKSSESNKVETPKTIPIANPRR